MKNYVLDRAYSTWGRKVASIKAW